MSELRQQIEKKLDKASSDFTSAVYLSEAKAIVLGLLADYEKEEENIRGSLAETTTKLIAKIEYLEREIVNMKEVEKESVCIPRKQLEELRHKIEWFPDSHEERVRHKGIIYMIDKLLEESK